MPWLTLPRTTQFVSASDPLPSTYTPLLLLPMADRPSKVGFPAATYRPYVSAFWMVNPLDDTVAAVARWLTPRTAWLMLRLLSVAAAAVLSMIRPYQEPGLADTPPIVTGDTTVPLTVRVPRTVSSTRLVSRPEAWPSEAANCTVVPAWMVSVDPAGTMMSPCTMYGLPAGLQVWLMMLPPGTTVSASAPVDSSTSVTNVASAVRAERTNMGPPWREMLARMPRRCRSPKPGGGRSVIWRKHPSMPVRTSGRPASSHPRCAALAPAAATEPRPARAPSPPQSRCPGWARRRTASWSVRRGCRHHPATG